MNILKPIEYLLLIIFTNSYKITNNYGISLLIMSIVITVGTYPLYRLADIWKEKELNVQKSMKKDIDKISRAFSGQKRFYLIQTTYRLHDYKSWYAFRTSLGILIQIPFFFAAYNVLSSYDGYIGYSFLFINDLSKPDGLFFGINFLPLLMTFFNILSSIIFSKSIHFRDNKQQYILAIVFLLFLYNSPAALLLYWTSNNFLSIFKSLIKFFKNKESINLNISIKKDILDSRKAILILIIFCFFMSYFISERTGYTRYVELLVCMINIIVFIYQYAYKKTTIKLINIVFYVLYGLSVIVYLLKITKVFGAAFSVLLLIEGYLNVFINLSVKETIVIKKAEELIYDNLIVLFLFFFVPLNIFFGNIDEFSISISYAIIGSFLIAILICTIITILAVTLFRESSYILKFLIFMILCYFAYTFIFTLDYGLLSEFSFQKAGIMRIVNLWVYLKDFLIVFLLLLLEIYILNNKKYISFTITLVLGVIGFSIIINYISFKNKNNIDTVAKESTEVNETVFSKNMTNVLYIMPDMMNGNYFERYIKENPNAINTLEGFTWYKDTLSIASATINSLPSMFGGYDFTPERLNDKEKTYGEIVLPEVKLFWENILEKNYTIENIVEWDGLTPKRQDLYDGNIAEDIYSIKHSTDYNDEYCKKYGINNNKTNEKLYLIELLSFFLSTPNSLKKYIYNEGVWNNENLLIIARRNFSLQGIAYFDIFTDIASAKTTEKNKFIYLLSSLTHDSYGINEKGELITSREELYQKDLPYYSAKKFLDSLINIIGWLKENNIYENTIIIICSDHGNGFNDNYFCNSFSGLNSTQKNDLSKCYPFFMVKRLNAEDDFLVSDALMQNTDVFNFINEYVLQKTTAFSEIENLTNRDRTFYACNENFADYKVRKGMKYTKYIVNGTIFNEKNWSFNLE